MAMKEDFFSVTAPKVSDLNDSDLHIYNYIVQNIHAVKNESIRALAHNCFVSTTTIFRFVQKMGFSGYADFINLLRLTDYMQDTQEPLPKEAYGSFGTSYLANITESIRYVMSEDACQFASMLSVGNGVVLISDNYCYEAARYAYRMLRMHGVRAEAPMFAYEYASINDYLQENDLLWVFTISGQENFAIECVERLRAGNNPRVVTFTDRENAMLRRLSDIFILFPISGEGQNVYRHSLVPLFMGIDRFIYYYHHCKAENDTEGE